MHVFGVMPPNLRAVSIELAGSISVHDIAPNAAVGTPIVRSIGTLPKSPTDDVLPRQSPSSRRRIT
jgi:hypothetical protein